MLTLIFWHREESYVDTDILAPRRVLCWHWYFGTEKSLMLTLIFRRTMMKDSKNKRKKCVLFNNVLNCWVYTAWMTCGYGIMTRYNGGTWINPCHSAPSHMKWWTLRARAGEHVSFYLYVTLKMETECCSEKSMSRYQNIINVDNLEAVHRPCVWSIIRITIDSQNTTTVCCSYLFVRVTTCFGPN